MRSTLFVTPLLLSAAFAAHADAPAPLRVSYSADYIMETAEGAMRGHLSAAPGKERREEVSEGTTSVTIRRDDKNATWMLMPAERMYMEIKTGQPGGESRSASPDDYKTEMTKAGREQVNGVMTDKVKVLMTGANGSKMGGFWWTTDDGIVVKLDVISIDKGEKLRMKRELSNIKLGAQPDDLFEIPAGYTSMAGGIAGGLFSAPAASREEKSGDRGDKNPSEEAPKKKRFGLGVLKDAIGR